MTASPKSGVKPIGNEALDAFDAFVREGHEDAQSLPAELVELGVEVEEVEITLSTGKMLSIIARLRAAEAAQESWRVLFCRAAAALNCLPSRFLDGNEHVFARLVQVIAAEARQQQWRPISEAPRDGTWMLLTGGTIEDGWDHGQTKPSMVVGRFFAGEDWERTGWEFGNYESGHYGEYECPTHYMPLPLPPEQQG